MVIVRLHITSMNATVLIVEVIYTELKTEQLL